MFGVKKDFIDGSKRINIDYKRIEEYNEPFVMILEVEGKEDHGKKAYDVWNVKNGRKAEKIREEYRKKGRYTSYVAFYKNIDDLIDENNDKNLSLNPRIRGKNKKKKSNKRESNLFTQEAIDDVIIDKNIYTQIPKALLDELGIYGINDLVIFLKNIALEIAENKYKESIKRIEEMK